MGPARRGRPASRAARVADVLGRGEGRRAARAGRVRRVRRAGREVRRDLLRVPHRGAPARARRSSATAPRARATPCSTTAASGPTCSPYTVDRNPYKHGRFTPGTRIPILPPEQIAADRPDYVLVLPWNLRAELIEQLSYVRRLGRPAGLPDPDTGGRSEHMKVVLFCGGYGMRMRNGAADDVPKPMHDGRPAPADLARHALLRALRAHGVHPVPRVRGAPHQGLLPQLRGDRVQRLRAAGRARWSCCPPTSPTGRSRSRTPGSTRRSGSGCGGCASTSEGDEMFLANYADVLTDAPLPEMIDQFRGADAGASMMVGAAAVVVPLRGPGRGRPGRRHHRGERDAAVGERRLLRAPPGGLRPHPGGRGPGRATAAPTGQARAGCWPTGTAASGSRPTP